MVTAHVLEATHTVDNKVARVDNNVKAMNDKVAVVVDGA